MLSELYPLDPATVASFREQGHAVVRGLASPDEIAACRPAIERAAMAGRRERRPLEERETYGRAFLQVPNLCQADPTVRDFVFSARFAKVAADLLGADGVRLYHDQALLKEPGGGHTPWHQDQGFWPLETDLTVTMWMPLVDVPVEAGPMTFASRSHREGNLGIDGIGDVTHDYFAKLVAERNFGLVSYGPLGAGDATFHTGWTLHSAPANPTKVMRSVMTVIYFADGTRIGPADSALRQFDLAVWLGGRQPGDVADGDGNPILYRS